MSLPPAKGSVFWAHASESQPARVGVIAEIGVNHDGDPAIAERLVHAAAAAGADAVKFQLFRPERLLSRSSMLAGYQQGRADDAVALLSRLTLSGDDLRRLKTVAHGLGLWFLVSPFSLADVDDLVGIGVDGVKIASPDAVNEPLLEKASRLGVPMLISTGTCDAAELGAAAGHIEACGGALLQCVSAYPTPDTEAALGGVAAMRSAFNVAIGYSDHTASEDTGALAVAGGACLLEKHLTYDRTASGPDHAASTEPDGLARYVTLARRAAEMVGPIRKALLPLEEDVRRVSRQSVCSTRDLAAGHVLGPGDLTVKRPGTGLPASMLSTLPGRVLARAVGADWPLTADDLQ